MQVIRWKSEGTQYFTTGKSYNVERGTFEQAVNKEADLVVIDDNKNEHFLDGKYLSNNFDLVKR